MKKSIYELVAESKRLQEEATSLRQYCERVVETDTQKEIRWLGDTGNFAWNYEGGLVEQIIIEDLIIDEIIGYDAA
jgi:hypothetical protein